MSAKAKNIFFLYELEHIPLLQTRMLDGGDYVVVGLDYEVELELRRLGIAYTSLSDVAASPEGRREPLEFARQLARAWYTAPEFTFFQHEGILLGESHEVLVSHYLQTLVYYLSVLREGLENMEPVGSIVIPESLHHVPTTADPVDVFRERLPVDVVRMLGLRNGTPVHVVSAPASLKMRKHALFLKERILQGLFPLITAFSNALVSTLPSRPFRLLATDPWDRIEPVLAHLPDAEIVMTRRREMKKMGLNSIWRTHARFHHQADFIDRVVRRAARLRAQSMRRAWEALGEPHVATLYEYEGISLWPIVQPMLENLVTMRAEEDILTIENTKRLLSQRNINRVLLFGSTKGYNNIIARVAESMNIPSIELQHALEPTEPSFIAHARLPARYLAAYGTLTKRHYRAFGVEAQRIFECGSPRFDRYTVSVSEAEAFSLRKKLRLRGDARIALVLLPYVYASLEHANFSTYSAWRILEDLAAVQKRLPWAQFLLRPRPGEIGNSLYRRPEAHALFPAETRIVQYENLRMLLFLCNLVVAGNSAVVLEAMLMHRPVVLYLPRETDHDFDEWEAAGALRIARDQDELQRQVEFLRDENSRTQLVARADEFLRENFMPLLDGRSAERLASLLRKAA